MSAPNDETTNNSEPGEMERNEYFLSPDPREGGLTPVRVLSHHSLAGEDIALSGRRPSDYQLDLSEISPFTPSEATHTPPSIQLPVTLSPPPINPTVNFTDEDVPNQHQTPFTGRPVAPPQPVPNSQPVPAVGQTTGLSRPPRVPHVSFPTMRTQSTRHGRVHSNSDYSFLSALTDSTADPPTQVPKRRTLSWDNNDFQGEKDRRSATVLGSPGGQTSRSFRSTGTPASILQPVLQDAGPVPPPSIITGSSPRPTQDAAGSKVGLETVSPIPHVPDPGSSNGIPRSNVNSDPLKMPDLDSRMRPIWNPTTGSETGSFVLAHDDSSKRLKTPPKAARISAKDQKESIFRRREYSINDVLDAYPAEPEEETIFMNEIESKEFSQVAKEDTGLLPAVPETMLMEDVNTEGETKQSEDNISNKTARHKNSDTFGDLAQRLLDGSPARNASSSRSSVEQTQQKKKKSDTPKYAGDALYEAAETLFGRVAESTSMRLSGRDDEEGENVKVGFFQSMTTGTRNFRSRARSDLLYFGEFLGPHAPTLQEEFTRLLRWIMLPSLGIAALLFYPLYNPPTGYFYGDEDQETDDIFTDDLFPPNNSTESTEFGADPLSQGTTASVSWWLIFLGVRQVITLELARFTQLVVIDFLTFRTKSFPRLLGPSLALCLAQSKGWPFLVFSWSLWDIALLYGDRRFSHHWMYWQSLIGMFSERNPHGNVTSHDFYKSIVHSGVGISALFAVKRAVMGQNVGTRVVRNYRSDMAHVMRKLILLNDLSILSLRRGSTRQSERKASQQLSGRQNGLSFALDVAILAGSDPADSFDYSDALSSKSYDAKGFTASAHMEMMDMLEEWEEPELQGGVDDEKVTMATVLQFRRAQEFLSGEYPFSQVFGSVRTRQDCLISSQKLFDRLLVGSTDEHLKFDVLCLLAKGHDGSIDRGKVRDLIKTFRPDRNGNLSKLDFAKSVDSVYKSLRLLLASIKSSSQIDKAYESIVNSVCFIASAFIVMTILGVNVEALIILLSGFIVSFAFMIGTASAKYFEGVLFVLVRRPYDIGDRVAIEDVQNQSNSIGGESSWFIEKVDLYSTTARLGTSREVATFSNGSLAGMRITNLNRSERPNVYLFLKFSVNTTQVQRQTFRTKVTEFVRERPRQWVRLVAFRTNRVETDLGFVEYILVIQHREKWQNLPAILTSRGAVYNYSIELQKELNMRYTAPHVPIDIRNVESLNRTASSPFIGLDGRFPEEPKKEK